MRPIPTPVHNLRPARETCEQCHWPSKFVGDRLRVRTHYEENETNDEVKTVLGLKDRMAERVIGQDEAVVARAVGPVGPSGDAGVEGRVDRSAGDADAGERGGCGGGAAQGADAGPAQLHAAEGHPLARGHADRPQWQD